MLYQTHAGYGTALLFCLASVFALAWWCGHGERSRLQLLFKFGPTENNCILAVNVLAVNCSLRATPLYSVKSVFYTLHSAAHRAFLGLVLIACNGSQAGAGAAKERRILSWMYVCHSFSILFWTATFHCLDDAAKRTAADRGIISEQKVTESARAHSYILS